MPFQILMPKMAASLAYYAYMQDDKAMMSRIAYLKRFYANYNVMPLTLADFSRV